MTRRLILFLVTALTAYTQIPGMDMAVMQKWSNAKVIRFEVTGIHQSRVGVIHGDYEGKADVTDKLVVEYTLDNKSGKLIGDPKITDFPSEVTNVKADGTNCPPPQLKGPFELFKTLKHTVTSGKQIQIEGNRIFPAASVSQYPASCSLKPVPGATVNKFLFLSATDARLLGMPIQTANKNIRVAPDRKSFTLVGAKNWVWTYVPTQVE